MFQNVIYAELQPQLRAAAPHQALDLTDRVQYASLVHNTGVKLLPTADHHDPGKIKRIRWFFV